MACGLAVALGAAAPMAAGARPVPSFEEVRAAHRPSDLPLLARDGSVLQLVRTDPAVRRGRWLALHEISPALRTAIVLGEDRRFWAHSGVDWPALAAAAWANAWNQRTRGASTLTMQLAALADEQLARPAGGRSLAAKLTQMQRAQAFEASWSKAQILEAYLNRVPLRGELVGVDAAAQQLFGKHASGLDAVESALLAAMVRAPNAAPALVVQRACGVLEPMNGDCTPLEPALARALARKPGPLQAPGGEAALAPHLGARLAAQAQAAAREGARRGPPAPQAPASLPTTLDAPLQRLARAALARQLAELRGRNVEDGAVIVLDRASGEVLAWVGSSGRFSDAAAVDTVLARRQAGSTLKPFVYALAFEQRLLTAATPLADEPLELDTGGALYRPQNYDHGHRGAVPARQALAASLNLPAVRVAAMLGPDAVFERLQRAGLALRENGGWHGHALALGSAEVTLADLANAYRTLANGGAWSPITFVPPAAGAPPAPQRRVFDAATAWLVSDILADGAARAGTFGLDSPLVTRGWAAVKTGTSKDMRDNWCLGFSARYVVGVWIGNASGAPMHGVSGTHGAAPVWRELMLALHAGQPSAPPPPPEGLARAAGEWFLPGTAAAAALAALPVIGITSPSAGSIVMLDPDIPRHAQRLVFEGEPGRWSLNGQPLGEGSRLTWLPRPGRHVLERRSPGPPEGRAPDRVLFEVRAAPPPAGVVRPRATRG